MKNIHNIRNCYGCGVCAVVCPQKIISINLNVEGFYEPQITDYTKCIDCGLCLDVCAYSHNNLSVENIPLKSFAAWSKDLDVRKKCTSGGVGFEIGRYLVVHGYKVCGVRYNIETNKAEHYIASTIDELIPSIGSKYIQSYTVDGFRAINKKEKYLVTGTPCQIDSFRRYIRKFKKEDNFILMDFFCHGVPSMLVWEEYVKWAEAKVGKFTYVSWRNKFTGWHDSYNILIKDSKGHLYSRLSNGDMFFKLFFSNTCLGKACYGSCKYKYNKSAADIRIGDLWGEKYKDNEDGVSAVISFTAKGCEILSNCNVEYEEHPFAIVAEGQAVKAPDKPFCIRKIIIGQLQNSHLYSAFYIAIIFDIIKNNISRIMNPRRTFMNFMKRIKHN